MQPSDSRHISLIINADAQAIYEIARDLNRLPSWASGLAAGALKILDDNTVVMDSPMGRISTRFTPRNSLGILDHIVTLPDGTDVLNPLRLVAHDQGTEVIFSIRRGSTGQEDFDADCAAVRTDLEKLATLAEISTF